MGMLSSRIDFQIAELLTRHRATWQHAFDGHFNEALWEFAFQHFLWRRLFNTAGISRVTIIFFVRQFFAREFHFFRIDDNDVIARVCRASATQSQLPSDQQPSSPHQ